MKVEQPKIAIPKIKPPELPKQPTIKMDNPKPVLAPPAPQRIIAMAAPVAVSLAHPQAASVPNNDPHPSAVRLGNPTSPLNNLKGPAVASVNLAAGFPGMNSANSGNGPPATKVVLGNGSPESTSIKGNGVVAVAGIPDDVTLKKATQPITISYSQVSKPRKWRFVHRCQGRHRRRLCRCRRRDSGAGGCSRYEQTLGTHQSESWPSPPIASVLAVVLLGNSID